MSLLAAAIVALGALLFAAKSRYNYRKLPALIPGQADLDVAIIVPARNEAANIERVIRSFPPHLVTVVDDQSEDGTAALASRAGARVIPAQPRVGPWLGKPNACWTGALATQSRWLLFVDADTWYEPPFLPSLLAYAQHEGLGAASIFPRQVCLSISENTLLPYAFGLYFCGVSAANVNNERHPEALANGQCLLVSRDVYQFIGGHKAVATSVIEDVALASLFKRHRVKAHVLRGESFARVRMYDSLGALWRGFQKNSFRFLLVNPWCGLQVVAASILLTSWLPVLVWLYLDRHDTAARAFLFLPLLVGLLWYGNPLRALLAPIAIYLFQLIALTGMFKTILGLKTRWKGRPV